MISDIAFQEGHLFLYLQRLVRSKQFCHTLSQSQMQFLTGQLLEVHGEHAIALYGLIE